MSRYLLAIPVFFAASITAAACSSSSTPVAGTGDGGGTVNPDCETLSACCSTLPSSSVAMCTKVVTAGGANCTTQLASAKMSGFCTGVTMSSSSSSAGTSAGSSASTSGTGTGTGGDAGMTGSCTPTLPTGWAPETITLPPTTSCTSTTATALADDCFNATDASNQTACNTDIGAACGECMVTLTSASVWGTVLLVPEGSGSTGFEVQYPFDFPGNCIATADPTHGAACNTAFTNLVQCELASCTAQCPVASEMDTAGTDAFVGAFDMTTGALTTPGCIQNADNTTCMTFATAFQTACGADEADGSATGVFAQCEGSTVTILQLIEGECGGG